MNLRFEFASLHLLCVRALLRVLMLFGDGFNFSGNQRGKEGTVFGACIGRKPLLAIDVDLVQNRGPSKLAGLVVVPPI